MKSTAWKNLLIALCAAVVLCLTAGTGLLRRADKWAQDALFQRPGITSGEILLIGIDEETLAELGPYHTWDRNIMASALEALGVDPEKMPAVVAIDTLYAGESDPTADRRLAEAAGKLPAVVTASLADFGTSYEAAEGGGLTVDRRAVLRYEQAYPALLEASHPGHINAQYDLDGIMRHAMLYVDVPESEGQAGSRVYSMAREAARLYLESRGGSISEPETDARGNFYVAYTGKPCDYYDGYSLAKLVKGEISPAAWAGRIVLIGPYTAGLQDEYFTPIARAKQMNGVEVQANVIQVFLGNNFKQEAPDWPQLLVLGIISFGTMLLFLRIRVRMCSLFALGLAVIGPAASLLLYGMGWVTHPLWLPAAALLLYLTAVVRHYALAALERKRVTRTFERYVAPEIVREILQDPASGERLGGSLCNIAVLFVDIRGFTSMSERMEPEAVVRILNRYLTITSSCVEKNRGTLDKFVGDATMAFWGAPVPAENPVLSAAKAAMEIVAETNRLSAEIRKETGEELKVGIGIHYGPAVVGNMGSQRRMDYTAIGDTVNTAARLEANAPGSMIYISRAVAEALGSAAKVTSLGGTVRLKGKTEGFEVLELNALETGSATG